MAEDPEAAGDLVYELLSGHHEDIDVSPKGLLIWRQESKLSHHVLIVRITDVCGKYTDIEITLTQGKIFFKN